MRYAIATVLLLFCAQGSAFAQAPDPRLTAAALCTLVTDSLQRLLCFDKVFPRGDGAAQDEAATAQPLLDEPTTPTSAYGVWTVEETKSAIDDSPTVVAYLKVDSGALYDPFPKAIVLRCMENTTNAYLTTDTFAIGQDTGTVTLRVDNQPARTERWELATDNRTVGLWTGTKAIPFMREIRGAKKLAFRVEMRDRANLVFDDVSGLSAVVDRIAEACAWPKT